MNKKVINSILTKKFNDWVKSIKDETVANLVKDNSIITGGAIASMLLNEEVKDFDVYFTDRKTTLAVTNYYVTEFLKTHPENNVVVQDGLERIKIYIKSKGVTGEVNEKENPIFEDAVEVLPKENENKYRPVYLSSNAITLSDKIQIVIRFFGIPEEIHKNYDFIHCTNYWTSKDSNLVLNQKALESILSKELFYVGSKYPLCSVIRTRKFIKRGWHINAGQYLKMMFQISELDLTNINVLEDQLVGVDSAYFDLLICGLKSKHENDTNFKVTDSYLAAIIDKIF